MKQILFISLIALCLSSANSFALAIGNAKTISRYGEPISLEVELYGVSGLDKKSISYKILSMYGDGKKIDHKNAKFGFYSSGNIGWLTISFPVKSSFRNIAYDIEVSWPGGSMARSYSGKFLGSSVNKDAPECHSNGTLFSCAK